MKLGLGSTHHAVSPKIQPQSYDPDPFDDLAGTFINRNIQLPPFDPTKSSTRKNGIVKAYAANTHQGLVRTYNEDRVSIILNILRPKSSTNGEEWPSCSFFAVYDGHGGTACADFLRDNLHQFV
jgi:protein phosphatase 2C family protein 2/3